MIKSRFSLTAFINFGFCVVFLMISLYLLTRPDMVLKGKTGREIPAFVPGFLILILDAVIIYTTAKRSFLVSISPDIISIKGLFERHNVHKKEIQSIDLLSIENLFWAIGSTTICTSIKLQNGKKIVLADPFYGNISRLKQCLFESYREEVKAFKKLHSQNHVTQLETEFEIFSGNRFFNFRAILFYGLAAFFVLLFIWKPTFTSAAVLAFPIVIFYLSIGYQLHYFLISNKRIVVRNIFLPWVYRSYDLDDVIAINFESAHKQADAMRITTSDFKSGLFQAGSLKQKNWKELRERLRDLMLN